MQNSKHSFKACIVDINMKKLISKTTQLCEFVALKLMDFAASGYWGCKGQFHCLSVLRRLNCSLPLTRDDPKINVMATDLTSMKDGFDQEKFMLVCLKFKRCILLSQ